MTIGRPQTTGKFATRADLEQAIIAGRESGKKTQKIAAECGCSLRCVYDVINGRANLCSAATVYIVLIEISHDGRIVSTGILKVFRKKEDAQAFAGTLPTINAFAMTRTAKIAEFFVC